MTNKQALREAAEKATQGMWRLASTRFNGITAQSAYPLCGKEEILANAAEKRDAEFIAAANPDTVLALLDELEAAEKSNEFLKDQLAELANFNPDWDKLEASYESWREIAAELLVAKDRIAELEAREGAPLMFIDGDISPDDAEKLAAIIRDFNEETETPAARMARIIRENPHPTNMCDMPSTDRINGEG